MLVNYDVTSLNNSEYTAHGALSLSVKMSIR